VAVRKRGGRNGYEHTVEVVEEVVVVEEEEGGGGRWRRHLSQTDREAKQRQVTRHRVDSRFLSVSALLLL
jgi:hypothetical protein